MAFLAYDAGEAAYQYCTTGSVSATTKAALGADALATVVPGLTGTGLAVRAGAKAAEAGAKVANTTERVLQTANRNSHLNKLREKSEIGQEAHRQIEKELSDAFGARPEVRIDLPNKTVRKDSQMPDGKYVIIKPDTKSGHKAAKSRQRLMENNGKETITIYYDPNNPAYLPGSPSYIGSHTK